ncbi:TadA family conjugal transfer-associated ATPase [Agromyces sp. MMS24-JH15]|uniref:TadA family conjugal transfer-associated ATPase n=1 Tax=Agromyces sp. MMS24-JH15 TaxID=3243765 RepID=UPI0037495571
MSIPFVASPSWLEPSQALPGLVGPALGGSRLDGAEPAVPSADAAVLDAAALDALGPLAPYAADGPVTDLFVNGAAGLWIDRGAGAERAAAWSADEGEVRALAVRLIARGGRHVDEATPAVDVRLGRGIRVHAVLPPVSSTGTLISVRIPRAAGFSLAALERVGMLDADQAAVVRRAIAERRNLLVTGAAGSGKTTLLGAMLAEAPPGERIVLIEDVAELRLEHPHVVALEARQPNLEGAGRVGLDALLREALRMRPDRLVVGECRGAELRELLAALNTGHDGGAGTLHANSLDDVPARLESLGSVAGLAPDAVARQTVSAFDLVLHVERGQQGRRLAGIGRFELDAGRLAVVAK